MNLITIDTLKTLLSITSTEYDSIFGIMIPMVSSDVRRILHNNFNEPVDCTITSGSNIIEDIYNVNSAYGSLPNESRFSKFSYDKNIKLNNGLDIGRIIVSDSFADETYITDYDEYNDQITVSSEATSDGTSLITSIDLGLLPTIAKMIWFRVNGVNSNKVQNEVKSKSMGVVSVSYETSINKKWNYPQQLINDLGTPIMRVN